MFFPRLIGSLAAFLSIAKAVDLTGYEYVVVGSGAGGGVSSKQFTKRNHY
jgi:choline dehydrogenase